MHRPSEADTETTDACNQCGRETHHTVKIELRVESDKEKNAEFSREPYRVATCSNCGTKHVQRMNHA
ncbi:hypothetical protein PNP59_04970 [Halobacterium salinarum]|nr:hypothetical protein [Halobacterium salinarum]MDL0130290.1 hypothetical protein [Halobacterium salinarum]